MAKELKVEITITDQFMKEQMISLIKKESEGGILSFMALTILKSEMESCKGEPVKVHSNDLLGADDGSIDAFIKSVSMILGIPRLKSNDLSSGKTIEDIVNGEPDEE